MNKKSEISSSELIALALGIIALIVIIVIIAGPENLLAKARDLAFSLGLGALPGDRAPEFAGEFVPEEIQAYFDAIVSKIENKQEGKCLDIGMEKPKKWKGFYIAFYTDKIELEKKEQKGMAPSYDIKLIDGFKPCFYHCESNSKCDEFYTEHIINEDSKIAPFLIVNKERGNCILRYETSLFSNPLGNLKKKYCS